MAPQPVKQENSRQAKAGQPILPLDSADATLETVGGKGLNLAKLARAGLPVPAGFLITTSAYKAFLATNRLANWIAVQIGATVLDDPAALEAVSSRIRARFRQGTIPPALVEQLCDAYTTMDERPVAVRSSATAEDLPDLSFAGQQDTFLNVVGQQTLQQAVVDCWSSLWTARAIGYRARNDIDHQDVALAVVVQEMVQSEASGVLFTANPLSGKRTETVIDATLGLGEALVSGQVEPDQYVVETASGRILSRKLGAKALSIRSQNGGGTVTRNEDAADKQAIPDPAIVELTRLGRQIEERFGSPQDVEWAWTDGRLYLLQSRPITSLYPVPEGDEPRPLHIYFSFGAVQGMLDPMTPLGRDMLQGVFAGGARLYGYSRTMDNQGALATAGERLFVRLDTLLRNRLGRTVAYKALTMVEPGAAQALLAVLEEDEVPVEGKLPSLHTTARILRAMWPALRIFVYTLARPDESRAEFRQYIDDVLAWCRTSFGADPSLAKRIKLIEHVLYHLVPALLPRLIPRVAVGVAMINRLLALVAPLREGDPSLPSGLEVTRGLPHNVTTEMDLILWTVASVIGQDAAAAQYMVETDAATLAAAYQNGTLPTVAQAAVAAFLDKYGARGLAEIDIGRPTWQEKPVQVMQMVQNYLHIEEPDQAPSAVFARGRRMAQEAVDRFVAAARTQPGGRRRAALIRWTARRVRSLAGLRESPKFFVIRMFAIIRQVLLDNGETLVAEGVLDRADDVFFLHLRELKRLAAGDQRDWRALVAQRRAAYAREKRRKQIPRLLVSDGRAFYTGLGAPGTSGDDDTIVGSPVSPGVVEGTVHVVFDPHGANLAPGEILVCPGTDPAWTPLFLSAGGLVMEVGGMMTHGSVVAREYGIPAVVGVDRATQRLETGQRIRVDGSSGRITLLEA